MMRRRAVRMVLVVCVVVLATAAIAAAWLLTSQSALDWAVARLHDRFGRSLVIEGAKRTGTVSFDADRIRYVDAGTELDVRDVKAVVSFGSLLNRRPVVERLDAAELRVVAAPGNDDPLVLPASLAALVDFEVQRLRLGRLVIVRSEAGTALGPIDLSFAYARSAYALILHRLDTPWGTLAGRATLAASPPYAIDGTFSATATDERVGRVELALAGDLAAMGIGAAAQLYGRPVVARAAVLPFSRSTIALIQAQASAVELRAVHASLPRALLDVQLDARLARSGSLQGELRIDNRAPGLPAAGRLPLVSLRSRFAGAGEQWSLDALSIDAGRAGRLSGEARMSPKRISADLQAHGLDLSGLHAKLHATAFAGPLRIETVGERVSVDSVLRQPGMETALTAIYEAGRIEVTKARWTSAAGRLEARGAAAIASPHAFEASGRIAGVDPSRLGDFPPARLNASFEARGEAVPLSVAVDAKIADSRFRNQPLTGTGRLRIAPDRVHDAVIDLRLGTATASAAGSFGAPADRLSWTLDLPDAAVLAPDAGGAIKARGTLGGAWRDPSGTFEVEAAKLRAGERLRIARAKGKGVLAEGWSGRMEIGVDVEGMQLGDARIDTARLAVDGTRARHEAVLSASGAEHRLDARLAGGLDAAPAWRGTLQTLAVRGAIPVRLEQPVDVVLGAELMHAGAARLTVGKGRVELAGLDWSAAKGLSTRGTLAAVALGGLHPVLPVPEALRPLVVGGQWDVVMAEALDARVNLRREGGDIVVPGSPAMPAQLSEMTVTAQARGPEVSFEARIVSGTFGHASATGSTRAERREGRWGVAGSAPLTASVEAAMPSLAWTKPLLGDVAALDGAAELSLRVSGSVAEPVYAGRIQSKDLVAHLPELGLTLRDGVLEAAFDRQQLAIRTLRFASGDGRITGTGAVTLVPERLAARVDLTADKLTVLARPDRLAVVSGQVGLAWDKRELRAQGKLTADRGVVELPREDTPRPSSDVVVIGVEPVAKREVNIHADLALDLGRDFTVRGRGLATKLGGTLRVQLAPRSGIVLTGSVRTVEGTYTAFGQKLDIQRGVLTFAGPADNPALDILAVRKLTSVEVGVAVGGSALVPQIRLVSTPPMSDADKLAWLTLGHGLDQAGRNDTAMLQAAAQALLSRGNAGTKGSLASRFGLDDLSLGTASGTGERVVSVGKRFASNFYLGFERGITGAVNVMKITYDLSRRWSVQARAGSENAVDLFYTLGFR